MTSAEEQKSSAGQGSHTKSSSGPRAVPSGGALSRGLEAQVRYSHEHDDACVRGQEASAVKEGRIAGKVRDERSSTSVCRTIEDKNESQRQRASRQEEQCRWPRYCSSH